MRLVVAWLADNEMDIAAEPFAALVPPESVNRLPNLPPDWIAPLAQLSPQQILSTELTGGKLQSILTKAPGNGAPVGAFKVITGSGWFAARPSGTEDIYKMYAESFRGADHLRCILAEVEA